MEYKEKRARKNKHRKKGKIERSVAALAVTVG